jgi:hypothetical protein
MQLLGLASVLRYRSHLKWAISSTNLYVQVIATKNGTGTLSERGSETIEIGKDRSAYDT